MISFHALPGAINRSVQPLIMSAEKIVQHLFNLLCTVTKALSYSLTKFGIADRQAVLCSYVIVSIPSLYIFRRLINIVVELGKIIVAIIFIAVCITMIGQIPPS